MFLSFSGILSESLSVPSPDGLHYPPNREGKAEPLQRRLLFPFVEKGKGQFFNLIGKP